MLAAAASVTADDIGLVCVGDVAQRSRLEAAAANTPNVRFLPFFPASKISSVLAAADAHVITVKRGLEGVVVPSKMYGILAAGKPIVAVAPRLARDTKCDGKGECLSARDAASAEASVDPSSMTQSSTFR